MDAEVKPASIPLISAWGLSYDFIVNFSAHQKANYLGLS